MVFKSWTILITAKTNLTMQTIWATATMQITQTTAQIPVTAQATLEKTQALILLKTADSSVEPLPESSRPRKDGPGGD